jgi:hypothetical protein
MRRRDGNDGDIDGNIGEGRRRSKGGGEKSNIGQNGLGGWQGRGDHQE